MKTFGKKILLVSSIVTLLWMICIGIFVYRSSFGFSRENKFFNEKSSEMERKNCRSNGQKISPGFWQQINLNEKAIPQSIKESLPLVSVISGSVKILSTAVHYIYAKPKTINSYIPVLLLHGQAFTSETWNEIGTIRILAALGYYPIAVDLPGYGKTSSIPSLNKSDFIENLITSLNITKPVLVSPSMSGSFSLRYLIEHPEKLGGYIPVSPVRTDILRDATCRDSNSDENQVTLNEDCQKVMPYLKSNDLKLSCLKVPTLAVWGERDRGENSARLCLLPESQGAEIPDGKHAAYLSNPELWHKLLYNFMSVLNETQSCS